MKSWIHLTVLFTIEISEITACFAEDILHGSLKRNAKPA